MQGKNASSDLVPVVKGNARFLNDLRSHLMRNVGAKATMLNFHKHFPISPGKHCFKVRCKC